MNTQEIILDFLNAYAGYPDRSKLSREMITFLRGFDARKSQALFSHLLESESDVFDPQSIEKLALAIGQFQTINGKKPFEEDTLPKMIVEAFGRDKFIQCHNIVIAAGRTHHILKEEIKGSSPAIMDAKKKTWHACFGKELVSSLSFKQAIKDLNVLILGETGTGKELFARVIQAAAFWHSGPNMAPTASVNVAAFTESLIDSELFGHKRGAFTGAMQDRDGLVKASHGGTFFLDEVGDLPKETQVKLLRVIETKKVRPVGSDTEIEADVRYISATNKDILHGDFRSDLYQRLAGTVIQIPPLRERSQEDIEEIAEVIIRNCMDRESDFFSPLEVVKYLRERNAEGYHWPGNVRELQSFIRGVILGVHIKAKTSQKQKASSQIQTSIIELPSELIAGTWSEDELKSWYFQYVYEANDKNMTRTAQVLGINLSTILRRKGKTS